MQPEVSQVVNELTRYARFDYTVQRSSVTVTPVTVTIDYSDSFLSQKKGPSHTEKHLIP